MATLPNFRTALNGYNRTDVVQFLQSLTTEHERELRSLQDENARLQEALEASRKELQEARSKAEALAAQAAAAAEQPQAKEAIPPKAPSLDAPMAPAASVVETVPSNFNEMELAAYRRAEMTERLARERAAASVERMRSVFSQADEKLSLTVQDLQTVMDTFRSDFDQMQRLLDTARSIFTESSAGVKAASELCDEA